MTYTRRPNLKTVTMYVVIPISRMKGQMLEDGQELAETRDQPMSAQDRVLPPPLTVFWEGEISLEVNPPFPGPGGLYGTPTFSGGEAGRRTLRSFRSNDLALCERALEAVKAWAWRMRSSSSGDASCGCNISVVSLWTRKCSMVRGQCLPSWFLGPHILPPLSGNTRNWQCVTWVWDWRQEAHMKTQKTDAARKGGKSFLFNHFGMFTSFSLLVFISYIFYVLK